MKSLCPLASGSKGNATYLESQESKVLIDGGLSGRALIKRLDAIEVNIEEIDAIFVTHEHSDHIQGLKVLALKHRIPLIANHETAKAIANTFGDCPDFKIFITGEPFTYKDLHVHSFRIPHDAQDPVGFTFESGNTKVGICTDLGYVPPSLKFNLKGCNYLLLEANHHPDMVHACPRPLKYKDRVLGRQGHLSNDAAGKFLIDVFNDELKHVYLCHLSSECNTPERAINEVSALLQQEGLSVPLVAAHQETISQFLTFN